MFDPRGELIARYRKIHLFDVALADGTTHTKSRTVAPGADTTYGHALIADAWGTVLAECADGEGVAVAEIDAARTERIRAALPSLKHRRL